MFEAFGIVRQQSWDRALDWLELAARQGSRSAREQLLLLADNDRDPSVSDEASDDFWRHLHARISVDDRIVAGEKIPLSESPRIRIIKQFATEAECRWIMRNAEPRLGRATVFDARGDCFVPSR